MHEGRAININPHLYLALVPSALETRYRGIYIIIHSPFFVVLSSGHDIAWRCLQLYAAAAPVDQMEMRPGSKSQPHMSIFQAATTFIFVGAVSVPSATCNDARFLPESHILKQYTPSDCWGHEVDCTKTATHAAHVDCSYATNTSLHLVEVKSASELFFSQADFGYLGEFVSSLQNYCRPETQFDSSLTCTANLQFCSGVKLSISVWHFMLLQKRSTSSLS